jgi:uncharacterized protein YegL
MKDKYTHIAVVLDRSGSMSSICSEVVNGFNEFVLEQKKVEGEATLSLAQFDDYYEVVHDFINIKDMENIKLQPRGSTALLDAMGKTLEEVRAKVLGMKESDQPSKVIFVFITDGQENASTVYTRKQIFSMIKDLKSDDRGNEINWEFVFIGANQDAISEGGSMGISARSSITFDASGNGATAAFQSLAKSMSAYRVSTADAYAFSDDDYLTQKTLLDNSNVTKGTLSNTKFSRSIKSVIPSVSDLDNEINVTIDTK